MSYCGDGDTKRLGECRETGLLRSWESRSIATLGRQESSYVTWFVLPREATVLYLSISSRKIKTGSHKHMKTDIEISFAVLAPNQKRQNSGMSIPQTTYYSAVKRNELLTYVTAREDLQGIILWGETSREVICCLIQLRGVPEMKMEPLMGPKRQRQSRRVQIQKDTTWRFPCGTAA